MFLIGEKSEMTEEAGTRNLINKLIKFRASSEF